MSSQSPEVAFRHIKNCLASSPEYQIVDAAAFSALKNNMQSFDWTRDGLAEILKLRPSQITRSRVLPAKYLASHLRTESEDGTNAYKLVFVYSENHQFFLKLYKKNGKTWDLVKMIQISGVGSSANCYVYEGEVKQGSDATKSGFGYFTRLTSGEVYQGNWDGDSKSGLALHWHFNKLDGAKASMKKWPTSLADTVDFSTFNRVVMFRNLNTDSKNIPGEFAKSEEVQSNVEQVRQIHDRHMRLAADVAEIVKQAGEKDLDGFRKVGGGKVLDYTNFWPVNDVKVQQKRPPVPSGMNDMEPQQKRARVVPSACTAQGDTGNEYFYYL